MYADGTMMEILEKWQLRPSRCRSRRGDPGGDTGNGVRRGPGRSTSSGRSSPSASLARAEFWRALVTTISIASSRSCWASCSVCVSALAGLSRLLPVRSLGGVRVVVRGTPLIVQIFFIFFGANLFFGFRSLPESRWQSPG